MPPILPPQDGFLFLDREEVRGGVRGRSAGPDAAFMADSQVPWGVEALNGEISEPAWRAKPSWYLIATEDRMIPPPAQRTMSERAGATVTEVPGSHSIYVSQPGRRRGPDRPGRTVPGPHRQRRLTTLGGRQDARALSATPESQGRCESRRADAVAASAASAASAALEIGRQCSPGSSQLTRISDE